MSEQRKPAAHLLVIAAVIQAFCQYEVAEHRYDIAVGLAMVALYFYIRAALREER